MQCTHTDQIKITETDKDYCEECRKTGDSWVHLRMCLICGKAGCCDSSKNKHARKHYRETGHPLIRSVEPEETWRYCYEDHLYLNSQNKAVRKG
ncbi:MAG TPA: UBP-type zinc finger domain-containing protein [Halalkalibaculum sp.]|nr:UBP-type zinc finger domain-containing protein [Halalkalibaculum sp.]